MAIPKLLENKLKSCTNLPSLPVVAAEIVQLAQHPGTEIKAVADAVSKDPALSAKVLRIANSALYAQRRKSSNMRQALIVLGMNATLTLALSLSVVGRLSRDDARGLDFIHFWRRSILAATWARQLALHIRRPDAEEVFLAALLQDIGMLALEKVVPEVYREEAFDQSDHAAVCRHERASTGADHAAAGAWLARHWNLPEHLADAIGASHRTRIRTGHPHLRTFNGCVVASGQLADAWLSHAGPDEIEMLAVRVEELTGVEARNLGNMFETISTQLPVTEDIFEMELFDHEQSTEVFERAREVLIVRNLQFISEVDKLRESQATLESRNQELVQQGKRDVLTGVGNRRLLEETLAEEFSNSRGQMWPLSVAFVDLDFFKEVNDTHGHRAGDLILKEAAVILQQCVRDSDLVARYGGDEFVLVMPGTDHAGAETVCERVVQRMRAHRARLDDTQIGVTVSVGLATCDSSTHFETPEDLVEAADKALYVAKSDGRDQFASCLDNVRLKRA